MSAADAAWLGVEAPDNPMVVTAVLRFGGPVDWELFSDLVGTRMVGRYPAFRRRVLPSTRPFGRPVWADEPDFDLARHLQQVPDDEQSLTALVGRLLGTPLDMTRSPWQFHLIDGRGTGATVIARIHHCIADGLALASVLLSLADEALPHEQGAPADQPGRQPGMGTGGRPPLLAAARFGASVPATAVRILCSAREPRTALRAPLGTAKAAAWTGPLDLGTVQAIARQHGVTVNDVLLSVTAGALRSHLLRHRRAVPDLRVFVPVNLRPAGEAVPVFLGNRFGFVLVRLPLSVEDPVDRLHCVHDLMRTLRRGRQAAATSALLSIVGALPAWAPRLAARLLGARGSAIVTNVIGPRERVSIAGTTLTDLVFWPPQAASIGLGIGILSYAGRVTIGVAADRNVAADPARLAAGVEAELDELARRLG